MRFPIGFKALNVCVFAVFFSYFLSNGDSAARPGIPKTPVVDAPVGLSNRAYSQPTFVSQVSGPTYDCIVTGEQPDGVAPVANYRSSLKCTVGKPIGIVISLYQSNVNFPTSRIYIGPNRYTCPPSLSSCITPLYSRTIDKTQHLWTYAGVNILGLDGKIYSIPNTNGSSARTYNNKGAAYPLIRPTRGDMEVVPFPVNPPYVDRTPRGADFSGRLRTIYLRNGWTIPSLPQAHHIHPVGWGGSDDPQTNGVFLGKTTHDLFTAWWVNFSNLNW